MDNIFELKKLTPIKTYYYKYLKQQLKNENLSPSFVVFIDALSKQKFTSQQELTEYLGCNKAHTSRTLFKMQLKGLLNPAYSKKSLELTEKGKKFALKISKIEDNFVNLLCDGISENEKGTFVKVLDKFVMNASASNL